MTDWQDEHQSMFGTQQQTGIYTLVRHMKSRGWPGPRNARFRGPTPSTLQPGLTCNLVNPWLDLKAVRFVDSYFGCSDATVLLA